MAERIARKMRAEVNTSVRIGNRALKVTASIGLALGTDADREMYALKGKLSNRADP
jgi:GGDEF domain-containing protein